MNLNVNEERGILWWADVYRLYSSLIASSKDEFKSKINWVCSSCCDFYSFLPPGFYTFLNSFPWGWDELCHEIYLVRLTPYVLFSEFPKAVSVWHSLAHHSGEKLLFSWVIAVDKLICWGVISCGASCGLVWKWVWGQSNLPLMSQSLEC